MIKDRMEALEMANKVQFEMNKRFSSEINELKRMFQSQKKVNNITCPNCKKDTLFVEEKEGWADGYCDTCGYSASKKLSFEDTMALDH